MKLFRWLVWCRVCRLSVENRADVSNKSSRDVDTEANFISDCTEVQFHTPALTKLLFGQASFKAFLYSSNMFIEGRIHRMCLLLNSKARITALYTTCTLEGNSRGLYSHALPRAGSAVESDQVAQGIISWGLEMLQGRDSTTLLNPSPLMDAHPSCGTKAFPYLQPFWPFLIYCPPRPKTCPELLITPTGIAARALPP